MKIQIERKSKLPIFEQIFTQVKKQILLRTLDTNAPLPSVRSLAHELQISCATVNRAYDLLKLRGYVYTIPGKGYFAVSNIPCELTQEDLIQIEKCLLQIEEIAVLYNLGLKEVLMLFQHKDGSIFNEERIVG